MKTTTKGVLIYAKVVCIALVLFGLINAINSALFGNYQANRLYVYILIVFIIIIETTFICSHFNYKQNSLCRMLYVILIYILLIDIINNVAVWNTVIHCGMIVLWIVTYTFYIKCYQLYKNVNELFCNFSFVMVLLFAIISLIAKNQISQVKNSSNDIAVVSLCYYCLSVLPVTLMSQSKKKKRFALSCAILVTVLSLKRGAIITLILMLVVYYILDSIHSRHKLSKFFKAIMCILLIICAFFMVDYYSEGALSIRFSVANLQDGSGRARIYAAIMAELQQRGLLDLLFGLGSGSTSKNIGITAHNDYLEFLYCFGVVGLLLYIFFVICLVRNFHKAKTKKTDFMAQYAMLLAYFFGISIFEGAMLNFIFLYFVMQLAVFDGNMLASFVHKTN